MKYRRVIVLKNIVRLSLSFILVFSLFMPHKAHASDIENHWAKSSILELSKRNIMGGYGNDIYKPNNNITRAEFTKLILSSLNIGSQNYDSPFTDVKKGDWYYSTITTAAHLNLVGGTSATQFEPNKVISRQEISVMITRALNQQNIYPVESTELFLDEASISPYAKSAVKKLQHLGIVGGKVQGPQNKYYFKPKDNATRAEAAVMILRMLNAIENPSEVIRHVSYDYDFKHIVDEQMNDSTLPQTDYGWAWYDASRAMTEHYLNPNNFKNHDTNMYQFLVLSGSSGISPKTLNEKVLNNKGVLTNKAETFIQASKLHNTNDVYLISHALLETGNGTSKLATGIEVGLNKDKKATVVTAGNRSQLTNIKKTYNMFGIGAYDSCANDCGAIRAYESGWFTVDAAIIGGAEFISNGYISNGQDTLYKMRWNPANPTHYKKYATDVGWANKQTVRIKSMFDLVSDLGGHPLVFEIPAFKNQPQNSPLPTGVNVFNVNTEFAGDTATVKAATGKKALLHSGPHTNFSTVGTEVKDDTKVEVIGHNAKWYKVKINNNTGWMPAEHLVFGNGKNGTVQMSALVEEIIEDEVIAEDEMILGQVMDDGTPMYESLDENYEVLVELSAGTEVVIVDEADEFYQVYVQDGDTVVTGWVAKASVELGE